MKVLLSFTRLLAVGNIVLAMFVALCLFLYEVHFSSSSAFMSFLMYSSPIYFPLICGGLSIFLISGIIKNKVIGDIKTILIFVVFVFTPLFTFVLAFLLIPELLSDPKLMRVLESYL
ncbi:MAG: hypothetical protein BM556_11470 [Bacteriovorax sp. MedPE-SWde]|nr:MAG: hypothetical protein BM556_11470 [Bacteriovorax sp. MedPE-SWde]